MAEKSGPAWCKKFPGSNALEELEQTFQGNCRDFIAALTAAGAKVTRSATHRPKQRAYLMHWCCKIAGFTDKAGNWVQVQPSAVPAMAGVDIDWTHGGNLAAAVAAAKAMRTAYNIAYPAALTSRHTERRAIDMTVSWTGTIQVKGRDGKTYAAKKQVDLEPAGKTYGVIKLRSDPPHWSTDGR